MLTTILLLIIWVLVGFAYTVLKALGSSRSGFEDFNFVEKLLVLPFSAVAYLLKRVK